jgi:acyl-CoA synthetase (AMP-forming)/AMP-acid ligase II
MEESVEIVHSNDAICSERDVVEISYEFSRILIKNNNNIPNEPGFIIDNESLSWMELHQLVEHYLNKLDELILEDFRLGLVLGQCAGSIALMIACVIKKCSIVLLPSYYTDKQKLGLMQLYNFKYLLEANDEDLKITSNDNDISEVNLRKNKAQVCLLTSGTSSVPKCVQYSWNDLSSAIKISQKFKCKKWLSGFPLAHFAGIQLFLQSFLNDGCLVILKKIDPIHGKKMLLKNKVNYLNCTPTLMRQLILLSDKNWGDSLRHITLGGEVVDQALLESIKKVLPSTRVTHIYASSELGSVIKVTDGKAGFDASYIDGERLNIIEGELFVKASGGTMQCYIGKPLINNKWIGTHDLVEIVDGRVHFVGRKDDVIIVGGYKVSPYIVEQLIRKLKHVSDVVIKAEKNSIVGSLVKAVIYLQRDVNEKSMRAEIIKLCKKELPDYMQPRLFEFKENLELTKTQKLLRE